MNHLRKWFFSLQKHPPVHSAEISYSTRSLPEANKWVLSEFVLDKLVGIVGIHPYPLDELLFMCSALAYFKPDIIIEWGTHYGKSARIFYEVAAYLNLQIEIHSIDLPSNEEHVENMHVSNQRAVLVRKLPVILHWGDGLTVARKLLTEIIPKSPLFFLDGDHSYTSVQNELNGIRSMTPRAVILVHDTFLQGSESGYNCDPYQALNEFATHFGLPLQSTSLGLPGMSLTYW